MSFDMFRSGWLIAAAVWAVVPPLLTACPGGSHQPAGPPLSTTHATRPATHGPFVPECGGASEETLAQLTGVAGLVVTARNPLGCQWLVRGSINGPWFSFSWFRGSPIGRERKNEDLTRSAVNDITIDGRSGYIAMSTDRLGTRLCDVAIQYDDDFFEWSIQFIKKPYPNPCDIAVELSRQTIAALK
jgi:hypothetical protein